MIIRGENGSHLWPCWQMCKITSFIWALILPLRLDREPRRATGHEEWHMWNGKLPHHHVTPAYQSESAAPAPGKNAPSFPRSLWRQRYGIIRPSPKPIPFKWHYSENWLMLFSLVCPVPHMLAELRREIQTFRTQSSFCTLRREDPKEGNNEGSKKHKT